jgi:hypothetical protein
MYLYYIMTKSVKKQFSGGELSENEFETYVDAMQAMVVEYENSVNDKRTYKRMIQKIIDRYETEDGKLSSKAIEDVVKKEFEIQNVPWSAEMESSDEDPIIDFGQKLVLKKNKHNSIKPILSKRRSTRTAAGGNKKNKRSTRKQQRFIK